MARAYPKQRKRPGLWPGLTDTIQTGPVDGRPYRKQRKKKEKKRKKKLNRKQGPALGDGQGLPETKKAARSMAGPDRYNTNRAGRWPALPETKKEKRKEKKKEIKPETRPGPGRWPGPTRNKESGPVYGRA